jgi:predicted DNA-binding transcriptional regulator AlpA
MPDARTDTDRPLRLAEDTLPARYLDTRQAAKYINVTPRALEAWRHKGGGPPLIRISSRMVRYDVRELDAWMATRCRTSTSDTGNGREAA